ncbi:MAG: NYN domain-containing protein [Candidatus Hodarchaeales archaeon]|jgi:hypothetical protein
MVGKSAKKMVRKRCPICHRNVAGDKLEAHFALHHPEAVDFLLPHAQKPARKAKGPQNNAVVVDGPNILHLKARGNKLPIKLLIRVIHMLKKRGYNPIAVCSARTKYQVDNPEIYVQMWKEGKIIESPAGEDDDLFILETARRLKAIWIVSNDRFIEYAADFPGIQKKRMRCSIGADGRIYLGKS